MKIFHAARGDRSFAAEQPYAEPADALRYRKEDGRTPKRKHDAQPQHAVHAVQIFFPKILRHEHASAARDRKKADIQQIRKLVCSANARKLNIAQPADHDRIHHVHRRRKKLLEHNRQAHSQYFPVERFIRKAEQVMLHKVHSSWMMLTDTMITFWGKIVKCALKKALYAILNLVDWEAASPVLAFLALTD